MIKGASEEISYFSEYVAAAVAYCCHLKKEALPNRAQISFSAEGSLRLRRPSLSSVAHVRVDRLDLSFAMTRQGPPSVLAYIRFEPFVIIRYLLPPNVRLPIPAPQTLLRA
jgi:hypothetical protein